MILNYRWGVGVARWDVGHDGAIDDTQIVNAVNSELGIDDSCRVARWSHFRRSSRMVNRRRVVAHKTGPVLVRPQRQMLTSGERLRPKFRAQFLEGGRLAQRQTDFDALDENPDVLVVDKVVWVDKRFVVRIGGLQTDVADRSRSQQHGHDGPSVPVGNWREIIVPDEISDTVDSTNLSSSVGGWRAGNEMELDVGPVVAVIGVFGVDPGQAFDSTQRRQRSRIEHGVAQDAGQVLEAALYQRDGLLQRKDHTAGRDMVLQVVADSQIGDDGNSKLMQMLSWPDTAQHEQLRRVDRSGG